MEKGGSALTFKAVDRRSAPRRRGPAKILAIEETGVPAKFQSQTFKLARYCVRKKMAPQDAGEAEMHCASGTSETRDGAPLADLGETAKE